MKILLDAFGGDDAPRVVLQGARRAKDALECGIVLVGNEKKIRAAAAENAVDLTGLEILHAPGAISMEDNPLDIADKEKRKQFSMGVGLQALKDGVGDAFVSAGSTGALVTGATLIAGRIKGVRRAAIGAILPASEKPFLLLDCGANAECSAEMLEHFAVLGSVYVQSALGVENPRVGLINIGAEESKGDTLRKETYQRLKQNGRINFAGNVEPRDIPRGDADVLVADGFTGNVVLKLYEGTASFVMRLVKGMFKKNVRTMLGALLVSGGISDLRKKMDYAEYGGAPLLGVNGIVIKAHGASDATAIYNACRQAKKCADAKMIERLSGYAFRENTEHA
jgi:glycerol-3-phosphate acyltransferase PlsX